jgi:S1-C subfamily serine protease
MMRPDPKHYAYDLAGTLSAMVGLRARIPDDAFTADVLGTERLGHGVFIERGIVLTIGYLITEAETIWLTLADGRTVPGHVLGYDQETGFGLVQVLARIDTPHIPLGRSGKASIGERVVIAGHGGIARAVAARIVGRQEFAGYWEYVLDQAIFVAPAHPLWGGAGLVDASGKLIGIGSLNLQHKPENGEPMDLNMVVPTDLLLPILDDLKRFGHPNKPARPWLGLYAMGMEGSIVVSGVAGKGPARSAGIQRGDIITAVGDTRVGELARFFRAVWALGNAGVEVPLTLMRRGDIVRATVRSGDRRNFLKGHKLH